MCLVGFLALIGSTAHGPQAHIQKHYELYLAQAKRVRQRFDGWSGGSGKYSAANSEHHYQDRGNQSRTQNPTLNPHPASVINNYGIGMSRVLQGLTDSTRSTLKIGMMPFNFMPWMHWAPAPDGKGLYWDGLSEELDDGFFKYFYDMLGAELDMKIQIVKIWDDKWWSGADMSGAGRELIDSTGFLKSQISSVIKFNSISAI